MAIITNKHMLLKCHIIHQTKFAIQTPPPFISRDHFDSTDRQISNGGKFESSIIQGGDEAGEQFRALRASIVG